MRQATGSLVGGEETPTRLLNQGRKKYGIVTREFKVDDQPWILKVNGKAGKR